MLNQILSSIAAQIYYFTGIDVSIYRAYLTIPAIASLFAFYFLYKGIKFVIKIILYIIIISAILVFAASYFQLF